MALKKTTKWNIIVASVLVLLISVTIFVINCNIANKNALRRTSTEFEEYRFSAEQIIKEKNEAVAQRDSLIEILIREKK